VIKIDIQKINQWCSAIFYVFLIIVLIIFTYNYAFVDWEEVSNEFSETFEGIGKVISCEIDYKDFHYSGFCANNERIFDFLNNQTWEVK